MKQISRISILIILMSITLTDIFAQFSVGTWRDHLPYNKCVDLCRARKKVYCATPYAVFEYNPADRAIQRFSKVNLLSDVGITSMEYAPNQDIIVVGYENGNIDLLLSNGSVNIPDIRISSVVGDKGVYDIRPYNDVAYLSTGFGVVVIDLVRKEIKETYFIGENGSASRVFDLDIYQNKLYAATEKGVITADVDNPFLANFANWTEYADLPVPDTSVVQIEFFQNEMLLVVPEPTSDKLWRKAMPSGTWQVFIDYDGFDIRKIWTDDEWMCIAGSFAYQMYHFDFGQNISEVQHNGLNVSANMAIADREGGMIVADDKLGLLWYKNGGEELIIKPQGPQSADVRRMSAYNNNLWIAHGSADASWSNMWKQTGISGFVNETWLYKPALATEYSNANTLSGVCDVMAAAIDPTDNNRVFFGSWEEGLIELNASTLAANVNNGNGSDGPKGSGFDWAPGWTGVAGVAFDNDGVLWCTNSWNTEALHAMDKNGTFYDFNFSPTIGASDKVSDVIVTQNGYVWANVAAKGLLVLNTNGTLSSGSDDNFKLLTDTEGNGGLPSRDVLCMQEDLDGEVWIGTGQGLGIFYNPDAIFSEENFDAEQILIEQDGNTQKLLSTETITCIEIDGSNRKWIGTQNSGAYLFSDDGLQEIYHFTTENSPLLSNNIFDIVINQENGEVYFGTQNGIVSFFSTATNFDQEMSNVRVFPNPVRPDYEGNITIDGLAYNTIIKVTDIQGRILFETESEGGRAVWDGKTFDGERPATGVYMVFVTTPDGSADEVRKVTFVK